MRREEVRRRLKEQEENLMMKLIYASIYCLLEAVGDRKVENHHFPFERVKKNKEMGVEEALYEIGWIESSLLESS
jgi:hypothetical protein